ncbi:phosphonate ABC transporter ATP-binding protein [Paenibacillus mucilaginosus]|uniref:Phosphonates import ATP-binding protein phnC n=3 Tax=Paenibacillus mucilaginosus TaxID=61624 RepID=H6NHU1_9BACL|nr:ATP-binding cassette domain-containing protein [Paenibacillus mucilaginosus]AEI41645.1 phosphonates import ATP-binding protein phnC [Paenibacillus mucilaginosus KNP414]AFC30162.1 phosphonates import ATP-binding protein phnC [Paenibacillus mucilaginosus 3016]AFH62431.1 phosphonate ABC transporter ATP-binding protein [Paenibacillus mucilaginosus K02]MCG7214345.1 ATP-binding cassette domain-containing protein [Paenibacillus mucilaginosus]WDM30633.1 ATP-binding cassette domain-containing protei
MIIVRNLSKSFPPDSRVLQRLSFQADEGELVTLLGASGSGKTTLFRCLMLQEKWDEGQYIYEGNDITKAGFSEKLKLRKQWAYLEEKPKLNPKKSALKNVLSALLFRKSWVRFLTGTVSEDDHLEAMDYLDRVGLLDKAHEPVEKLSGGEKQRVAVCKAMIKGARVIFADEPVSGLDPEAASRVMEDLQSICRKHKLLVFCSLHQIELAEKYGSRIWGLSGGKLVIDIAGRRLTQREKELIF